LVLQILKRSGQSRGEAGEAKEKREKLPWTESARSDLRRTIQDPTGGNNSGDVAGLPIGEGPAVYQSEILLMQIKS
jgi:hypothetical protein